MRIKRINRLRLKEALSGYLFVSPWLVGFFGLTFGPMVFSLYLGFSRWNFHEPMSAMKFIGLGNYKEIFLHDPLFWKALYNTAYYSFFAIPTGVIFALFLALLLNQKLRGISVFRTIFYVPALVTGVATVVLWQWILNPDFGVLNGLLKMIGIHGPAWLFDPVWTKPALIIMHLWGVGTTMLIFLAGLQNIPTHLYEVADLDGANGRQKFFHVTLPMLTPTIFFNLVMAIIGAFQVFTVVYILAGDGGPDNSLLFYVLYLYQKAFVEFNMGYASALAWILFAILFGLTLLVFRSSSLWVYYEGEKR